MLTLLRWWKQLSSHSQPSHLLSCLNVLHVPCCNDKPHNQVKALKTKTTNSCIIVCRDKFQQMRIPVWIHYELLLHGFNPIHAMTEQEMVCCCASTYCSVPQKNKQCSYQQEPLFETVRLVPWMRRSMSLARCLLSRSTDRGALRERKNFNQCHSQWQTTLIDTENMYK